MKIICFLSTWRGPSGRFRFLQYKHEFEKNGISVKYSAIYPMRHYSPNFRSTLINKLISKFIEPLRIISVIINGFRLPFYDIVYLNKDLSPGTKIHWMEKYFSFFNKRIYFDLDDGIFLAANGERDKKFKSFFPHLEGVINSNKYLYQYSKVYNKNSYIIPMGIDTEKYTLKDNYEIKDQFILGWSGSDRSYDATFPMLIPVIENLAKKYPIELIIIKNSNPNLILKNAKVSFYKWDEETEVESIKKMDVGLMPLLKDNFQKYKSALKALQYMAVGIPALVSPIGINTEIVDHEINGYHCASEKEWTNYIEKLILERNLIKSLGLAGRNKIEKDHSLTHLIKEYIKIFS